MVLEGGPGRSWGLLGAALPPVWLPELQLQFPPSLRFHLLSFHHELLASAALWMFPKLRKSHRLFLLPQGPQMQQGLVLELCHTGCSFLTKSCLPLTHPHPL